MNCPNLVFIYTDEQRADTLACMGNPRIQMPNLDRFAGESTVFERAYVTQAVCTPSRSSLLTGLWPHTSGCTENNLPLPAGTRCLPELLGDDAYATAHHGKWHLGDEIFAQHGFAEWRSVDDGYHAFYGADRDRAERSTYHRFLLEHGFKPQRGDRFSRGECARLPEAFGKPAYLAREASRFIRENRERPFMLFVNFFEPHMPYFGPRDNQYAPADVLLPANVDAKPGPDAPLKARLFQRCYAEHGHSGLALKTEADWRRMIANYWGLCSLVDTHAGAILDTIDACGLRNDTIVVFTSDHGDMMGSHRLLAKCVQCEEAIRVPLLIRCPGQTATHRVSQPISHIDLVPTLLDLLGTAPTATLPGTSRRAECEGRTKASHDDVIVEWNGPNSGLFDDVVGRTGVPDDMPEWMRDFGTPEELNAAITDPVRTILTADGWKFTCSPRGEHELHNLNTDPFETHNRFAEGALRPLIRDLRARLGAWQRRTGDPVILPPF